MEEIPNNHLGCIKPCKQTDTLPTSTGDRRISEPSTVSLSIGAPQVGSTYQRFNVKTADLMHLFLLRGPQLQEETVKLWSNEESKIIQSQSQCFMRVVTVVG